MIHIVVEGLDGTGKSTLVKALHERMSADQSFCQWIYATKEPGLDAVVSPGLPIKRPGLDLREIVLNNGSLTAIERELLFYVDASQHRRFIEAQGNAIILSDRGLWSHLAYLKATMKTKQMDYEHYHALRALINLVCPKPNLFIYLRGDTKLMKERSLSKKKDIIESNSDDFFETVSETYEFLSSNYSDSLITLNARNSTSHNVETVITSLKEIYSYEELKSGNLQLCGQ